MILVDTSVFIAILRGEKHPEVEILIVDGDIHLSSVVCLELFLGVRRKDEKLLSKFLGAIGNPSPWPNLDTCKEIAKGSRLRGLQAGLPDLMILADAIDHRCRLMTFDRKLAELANRLKIPLFST